MQSFRVSNLVFSSSCATYGAPDSFSISETEEQVPINPYGFSKLACEKLIEYVGEAHQIKFANLRYFNAAGADSAGEIGESHDPETHLIPLALRAAITKSKFRVFGGDYPTNDGSAIRDFIHVSDLAASHVRAIKVLIKGGNSFTCNLGTGDGFSVLEIMREIQLIFPDFKYSVENRRLGDPPRLVANIDLSKRILNLPLTNSSLQNILKSSLEWELKKSESHPSSHK
jgi:UDP-glucose 4-epimerase